MKKNFQKSFTLMSAILALAFYAVSCKANVDDVPQKTAGSISYATATVSKTTDDDSFTNELTKTGNGVVTYASSNNDVAAVNETTGEVTIRSVGKTTITATVADSANYTYATKTASYTLTVITIPEGFVKVTGTTITGIETWTPASNVFISGKSLIIPDLYVSDHEVTRGEYIALIGSVPTLQASAYDKDGNQITGDAALNNPVSYVNWYNAIVYCNKLSIKEGLNPCYTISDSKDPDTWGTVPTSTDATWNTATCDFDANGYRLPTEAEWEWLARGGENYTYAGSDTVNDVAWYSSSINGKEGTRDVKTKAPNAYRLYDMSGNVFEWCWDWSTLTSDKRVLRGGYYQSPDSYCRVFDKYDGSPGVRTRFYGFRVVRSAQ